MRLDAIIRVSKVGDRDHLLSPDQQRRDLEGWARRHGHELVQVHEAVDQSARHGAYPAVELAKGRALAGQVDGIVVAYLSRFTRNALYGLQVVQELVDAGRAFHSVDLDGLDLNSPAGRKVLGRELIDAQYESDTRAAGFGRAVADAIARGVHLSVPYGYRRSAGKGSPLTPDPDQAPVVLEAFQLRAAGQSWPSIADALNARGGRRWTHKTVRQVVANDVYLGIAHNGAHRNPDAHPAIVTPELAAKARRSMTTSAAATTRHLLAGIARCGHCGYAMTYQVASPATGSTRAYYRCRDQARTGCPGMSVPALELEALAESAMVDYLAGWDRWSAPMAADLTEPLAALEAAERRQRGVLELLADASPDERDQLQGLRDESRAAVAEARQHLRAARHAAAGVDLPAELDTELYQGLPEAERRHLLSILLAAVVVRPGAGWRQPVTERVTVLRRDQVPMGVELIGYAAGVGRAPAATVVAA